MLLTEAHTRVKWPRVQSKSYYDDGNDDEGLVRRKQKEVKKKNIKNNQSLQLRHERKKYMKLLFSFSPLLAFFLRNL